MTTTTNTKATNTKPSTLLDTIKASASLSQALQAFNKAKANDSKAEDKKTSKELTQAISAFNKPLRESAQKAVKDFTPIEIIQNGLHLYSVCTKEYNKESKEYFFATHSAVLSFKDIMQGKHTGYLKVVYNLYVDLYRLNHKELSLKSTDGDFYKWAKLNIAHCKDAKSHTSFKAMKEWLNKYFKSTFNFFVTSEDLRLLSKLIVTGLSINGVIQEIRPKAFTKIMDTFCICKVKGISFHTVLESRKFKKDIASLYTATMVYSTK